jgi:hypothetical protein
MVLRCIGLIILLAIAPAVTSAQVVPPAVPGNLEVPEGAPFLITAAEGTQNYICLLTQSGFAWTFFGPQATLFNPSGEQKTQLLTHFLSANPEDSALRPTWQHSVDTSAVWAAAAASSSDPAYVQPASIPWLLLRVVGRQAGTTGDALNGALYIHRVNTVGGVAPAAGCKSAQDIGKKALVPYTTDYVFYK